RYCSPASPSRCLDLNWTWTCSLSVAISSSPSSRSPRLGFTCANGLAIWRTGCDRFAMSLQRQLSFWIAALLALILILWLLSDILLPFIAGLVLAYFLDPVADALERLGLPRFAATLFILIFAILLLGLAVVLVVPVLAAQTAKFASDLPATLRKLAVLFNA